MLIKFFFLFLALLSTACVSHSKTLIADSLDATAVITGNVVNETAFHRGGGLLLGTFKAGPGTEANDQSDALSLMIQKGIRDTLPEDNTHFKVLQTEQNGVDFYLDGFIHDYGRDPKYAGKKLNKNQIHISVEGEVWLKDTGEKVLLFQTSSIINLKTQNPKTVAYQIGVAIAHFIGAQT